MIRNQNIIHHLLVPNQNIIIRETEINHIKNILTYNMLKTKKKKKMNKTVILNSLTKMLSNEILFYYICFIIAPICPHSQRAN